MRADERGAAATLAVFTVFVFLTSIVALNTFEEGYQRQLSSFHQAVAIDTTKATAASVETEANEALTTAVSAAMYEAGRRGETKTGVESRVRNYFNERISAGWSYSNFKEIKVPLSAENTLLLSWLPDGGLQAWGYLDASLEHLSGTKAFGLKLGAGVVPRYGRLYKVAHQVYDEAQGVADPEAFEAELNDNYASEFMRFDLVQVDSRVSVTIYDEYGGRAIAQENMS
ncbi:MAG: hypothetical protein AB1305_04310 [Candidatus Hadarchaeota archaeon]